MVAIPIPNTPHPTPLGEDPVSWLRLIRSRRVGAVSFHRLVAEHGSVAAALAALPGIAAAAGLDHYAACPEGVARAEIAAARRKGAVMLRYGGPEYPAALLDLPDAPPILWAQGDLALLHRPAIALIGARNASSLGLRMTRRLAEGLGWASQGAVSGPEETSPPPGFVIVSGLARGIDAEAHRAALDTGTIAVVAGGIDVVYPPENLSLSQDIARRGCLLSEQPMGIEPRAHHFPARNRIVSGLSQAVVVVEAAARSGSLITARMALDQGREVLAVPGHPLDLRAAGCNQLIRDGAVLVQGPGDVITALGGYRAPPPRAGGAVSSAPIRAAPVADCPNPPKPAARVAGDSSLLSRLLNRLGPSPVAEDQLIRDLQAPAAVLAPLILTLEIEGQVERQPGGMISRCSI